MASFSQQVWVDIDLEEFDDDELIEEMEDRGYSITKNPLQYTSDDDLKNIAWLLTLNKTEEALIQLERLLPELRGIKDKIKSAGVV